MRGWLPCFACHWFRLEVNQFGVGLFPADLCHVSGLHLQMALEKESLAVGEEEN